MSEYGRCQGRVRAPLCLSCHSHSFPLLCSSFLHSGPPASWLQPTLAVPLQDLSCIELGLAGQSLRLEWAAGAGSCVLLPRDAKRCRAFLDELTGERERGGRKVGPVGVIAPKSGTCNRDRQVMELNAQRSF